MTVNTRICSSIDEDGAVFVLIPTIVVGHTKTVYFGISVSFLYFSLDIEFIKDETI